MDRIGLLVELTGDEKVTSSLRLMKNTLDSMSNKKYKFAFDGAQLDREIARARQSVSNLQRQLDKAIKLKADPAEIEKLRGVLRLAQKELNDLTKERNDIRIDAKLNAEGIRAAREQIRALRDDAMLLSEAFVGIGSGLKNIGGTLQSIGGAFGGNFLSKVSTTLTAYGTIMATQGLSSAGARFDTFRTFPKLMEQVGFSTEQAEAAVSKMNEAVQGLPTGLNEIVESSKNYILSLNDIQKGTDLAIAANNAFLANASDSSQVYQGMRQIQDILAKGKLKTMEWQSLFTSLGTSIQPIAQELGYSSDQVAKFKVDLQEGAVAAMDFVDALIRAGNGSGALVERANIQKETLSATVSNIKNAFSIMGYNILSELDNVLLEFTGKTLPENVKGISGYIKQTITPALTSWLRENGDKIAAFIDRIKSFDWLGLFSSIGRAIQNVFSTVSKIVSIIPEGLLTKLITFASIYASPLGKAFSLLGSSFTGIGNMLGNLQKVFSGQKAGGLIGGLQSLFSFFSKHPVFGAVSGAIAGLGALITLESKYRSELKKNAEAIYDYEKSIKTASDNLVRNSKDRIERQNNEIETLKQTYSSAKEAFDKIFDNDATLKSTKDIERRNEIIQEQITLAKEVSSAFQLDIQFDEQTGEILGEADAIRELGEAYIELAQKKLMADAYERNLGELIDERANLEVQKKSAEQAKSMAQGRKDVYDGIVSSAEASGKSLEMVMNYQQATYDQWVANSKEASETIAGLEESISDLDTQLEENQKQIDITSEAILDASVSATEYAEAQEKVINKTQEANEQIGMSAEEVEKAREHYSSLRSEMEQTIKSQANLFGELSKVDMLSSSKLQSNIDQSEQALKNYVSDLEKANAFREQLAREGSMTDASGNTIDVGTFDQVLAEITAGGFDSRGILRGLIQGIEGYSKQDAYNYLYEILEGYDLAGTWSSVAADYIAQNQANLVGIDLSTLFDESFTQSLKEGNFEASQEALEAAVSSLEEVAKPENLLGMSDEAIAAIKAKVDEITAALEGSEGTEGFIERLATIGQTIQETTTGEQLGGILELLTQLNEVDMSPFIESMEGAKTSQDELAASLEAVATSAENANSNTGRFATNAQGFGSMFSPLIMAVSGLADLLSTAASNANNLTSAINNIPTNKTVNIQVNTTGEVSTGRFVQGSSANGGLVSYAADGGFVKRGTDTLPYMLTPGEFVVRRSATKKFFPLLEAINGHYIDNAFAAQMNALSARAIGATNNYRDNHASVVINNYGTTGQGYTQKQAFRFAGAL